MTASIREMSSSICSTQLSVSSRPASRTLRSWHPRGLTVLVVYAYLLQCANSIVFSLTGLISAGASLYPLVKKYGPKAYPYLKGWATKELAKPCSRCNPRELPPGAQLVNHLDKYERICKTCTPHTYVGPACDKCGKPCDKCGGDGLITVAERFSNFNVGDSDVQNMIFAGTRQVNDQDKAGQVIEVKLDDKTEKWDKATVVTPPPKGGDSVRVQVSPGIRTVLLTNTRVQCYDEAKGNIVSTVLNGTLNSVPNLLRKASDIFAKHCPICNKNGSKDSTDPGVKNCPYCEGDGKLHMTDRLSCPNCFCDDSGKRRKDCQDLHITNYGKCPTSPCHACRGKGIRSNCTVASTDPDTTPNPWFHNSSDQDFMNVACDQDAYCEGISEKIFSAGASLDKWEDVGHSVTKLIAHWYGVNAQDIEEFIKPRYNSEGIEINGHGYNYEGTMDMGTILKNSGALLVPSPANTNCKKCKGTGEEPGKLFGTNECSACNGTGTWTATGPCKKCKGTKEVSGKYYGTNDCPDCRGTGIRHAKCEGCEGTGEKPGKVWGTNKCSARIGKQGGKSGCNGTGRVTLDLGAQLKSFMSHLCAGFKLFHKRYEDPNCVIPDVNQKRISDLPMKHSFERAAEEAKTIGFDVLGERIGAKSEDIKDICDALAAQDWKLARGKWWDILTSIVMNQFKGYWWKKTGNLLNPDFYTPLPMFASTAGRRRRILDLSRIGDSAETILSRRRLIIGDSRDPPVLRDLMLKIAEANAING